MKTAGIQISEENGSKEGFIPDDKIAKLLSANSDSDNFLGIIGMFRKFPKLMKYVTPCTNKDNEGMHKITIIDITSHSSLHDIVRKETSFAFNWDSIFDYLWTEKT